MKPLQPVHETLAPLSLEEAIEVWANDINLAQQGWRDSHSGYAAAVLAIEASKVPALEAELESVKKELTGARLTIARQKKAKEAKKNG